MHAREMSNVHVCVCVCVCVYMRERARARSLSHTYADSRPKGGEDLLGRALEEGAAGLAQLPPELCAQVRFTV